ncbi:MAG: M14 family zinc carboxypeptidase [Candidatus Aminicenantes bacterium]|nr:M14 family zinc carboxypeptidase [Candidatus Aminicenantes bacterium]
MMRRGLFLMTGILVLGLVFFGNEQSNPIPDEKTLFSSRTYDSKIPTPTEFLGYGMGDYHTTYYPMVLYFQELSRISGRVLFESYGQTNEHRKLHHLVISSESNIQNIKEIKKAISTLADPEKLSSGGEAERIIDSTPAVVFLNYGTHGNETAGFEGALHTAYQLVAATDDGTKHMLEEIVVIITPALNPDGHERFVAWYNANQAGQQGTADANAVEHFAPWGVDTTNNHYQVNLNRDSVWNTQVESQALVRLYLDWNFQVFVDHHGQPEGFIGPWYAEPLNVEFTANQREWLARYGEDMAEIFREHGFRYTPWEFGILYPGYWDTFSLLNGAIAFTTESGGGGWKGLQLHMRGGHVLTLKHGIIQNLLADQSVLRMTAKNRRQKLSDYLADRRSAIDESKRHPVQAYMIPATNDPQRNDAVLNILLRNGIQVFRTLELFESSLTTPYFKGDPGPLSFSKGDFLVPVIQPQCRVLRALMDPDPKIPETYLDQVRKARKLSEIPGYLNPNIWMTTEPFYDVTAWSLPHTYNIEAYTLPKMPRIKMEPVTGKIYTPGILLNLEAGLGFVFDYASNRAVAAIARLRDKGIKFRVASSPFRINEHQFGRGAIVVFSHENSEVDLAAVMSNLVQTTGVSVLGVDSNLVDKGPHFGSDQYLEVVNKRIAVVRGGPIRPSSYGSIWFLCEQVYGVPFTALDFDFILNVDLREYGVLVFPDGFYSGIDTEKEKAIASKLHRWVLEGGSLVGIKGASAWLAKEEMGLTKIRATGPYVGKSIYMTDGGHPPLPILPSKEKPEETVPEAASMEQLSIQGTPLVPGAIFRGKVYPYHYLSYGYEDEVPVLVWSNLAFTADTSIGTPVFFEKGDRALVAGFTFPDSIERLTGTPYLMDEKHGLGHVILYMDDPNFRLYWDGLTRLFFNSIFFSNSF